MIKAVIFDMDGIVSDTHKFQVAAFESVINKHGINITYGDINRKYSGFLEKDIFEDISRTYNMQLDVDKLIEEKNKALIALTENNIIEITGSVELINKLKKEGFALGLASSSRIKFIELVLSELNVKEKFDAITSGEDIKHGKPDPEIFLLCAKRLLTAPEDCVVIEDSLNGMLAAKNAGMKCIGLVSNIEGNYPADIVVRSLKKVTAEKIKKL